MSLIGSNVVLSGSRVKRQSRLTGQTLESPFNNRNFLSRYHVTMSLATTSVVDGLRVIIAEAGISSWYNYYRENGLVTSPGGYQVRILTRAELTYSHSSQ